MNNQPNIFNYATSELTQDAFITWLLNWADPKFSEVNNELHNLGLDFLQSLLAKNDTFLDSFSDLVIKQQEHKIDVLITFSMHGKNYAIIIEDKVHSVDHSNQLERYKKLINNREAVDVVVPIYFKTGYQVNLNRIKENGYHHYTVKDFVGVVTSKKVENINNALLTQYHEYLLKKESDFDSAQNQAEGYLHNPIKDWTWWSCVRFFHEHKTLFNAGWGSVSNNREPLLAFWFGGKDFMFDGRKFEIYMDIQFVRGQVEVNYRLGLYNTQLKDVSIRNKIFEAFLPFLKDKNIEAKRPRFTKAKQTILLARILNLNRSMHHEEFVSQIKEYQNVLNTFATHVNNIHQENN